MNDPQTCVFSRRFSTSKNVSDYCGRPHNQACLCGLPPKAAFDTPYPKTFQVNSAEQHWIVVQELVQKLIGNDLRELRLWHWRHVRDMSHTIAGCEFDLEKHPDWYSKRQEMHRAKAQHTFHMKAVQTLNCFFALGDTAERDAE